MKFFKNGCNGGWKIFTRNEGKLGLGVWGIFNFSLHSWQRGANPPPSLILWRSPYTAYPYHFFKFCPTLHYFPVTSSSHPHCSFCCPVSCAVWVITSHLMYYIFYAFILFYFIYFMELSINFTEVWHIMSFFTGTLLWYHTHKHTQHTQGPVDRHNHINIYLHNLLCAHSSYSYYIKWLNE